MSNWTESLQPGDSVLVGRDARSVAKVTNTTILLNDGSRWRRNDGRQSRCNSYRNSYLQNPEESERAELLFEIRKAVSSCLDTRKLPLPVLRQLASLLEPYIKPKEES